MQKCRQLRRETERIDGKMMVTEGEISRSHFNPIRRNNPHSWRCHCVCRKVYRALGTSG